MKQIAGALLVVAAVVLLWWGAGTAGRAVSLYRFEHEPAATLRTGIGTLDEIVGVGPLRLDVVRIDNGRLLRVHRVGAPPDAWPRPLLLIGQSGARYRDEPASSGAWVPFAAVAAAAIGAALAAAVLGVRLARGWMDAASERIFGRLGSGSVVTWIPGSGTHGGSGQVPPFVPHNPDWDPANRIP